jgi:hypothetical protein
MRIGSFPTPPSINLKRLDTSALRSAGKLLGQVVRSSSQSGFDPARASQASGQGVASNLSPPPASLGTKGVLDPDPNFDMRKLVVNRLGEDAAKLFDQLPPEQQKEMAMQAMLQRIGSNLVVNMLQTLHDMSKSIVQNTRY